mmetsp:Transcript_18331/g.27280  ORF Transcript_18331/g.27280 Transcript_18331/m.27280 type:complete len:387 (-) Transcript_18331:26-1186(-)
MNSVNNILLRRYTTTSHYQARQQRKQELTALVEENFPRPALVVGYGSGVAPQLGYSATDSKPMVDFIFGVDDASAWHKENLRVNRSHYSFLGSFGGNFVGSVNRWGTAGMYYNPFVHVGDELIKYGVIELSQMLDDLSHWQSLFVAGRLQKPVSILVNDQSSLVTPRLQSNLNAALHVGLLLLVCNEFQSATQQDVSSKHLLFDEHALYVEIASISYRGDPRMRLGAEHPRKVSNIVFGNYEAFRRLYLPIIQQNPIFSSLIQVMSEDHWLDPALGGHKIPSKKMQLRLNIDQFLEYILCQTEQPLDVETKQHMSPLPSNLLEHFHLAGLPAVSSVHLPLIEKTLSSGLEKIISSATTIQHLKGLLSAGFFPAIRYLQAKLMKGKK